MKTLYRQLTLRQIYNLTDWKYGFNDCEKIENSEKASSYITKYITSALLTDKDMYGKKRYFNSQGLKKPKVSFGMEDNTKLNDFIPNFGIVGTDSDGKNYVDVGLYKLTTDSETGALIQKDTNYIIRAKNEYKSKEGVFMIDKNVPISEKYMLTMKEASEYFGIGENKLRRFAEESKNAKWLFMNGNRIQIKRKQFEKILDEVDTI